MANEIQPNTPGYTTVSIYDQNYHLRGQDPNHIRQLADLVDSKMRAVAAQGRTVDSLRVAVLAALNLADELSQTTVVDSNRGPYAHSSFEPLAGRGPGRRAQNGIAGTDSQCRCSTFVPEMCRLPTNLPERRSEMDAASLANHTSKGFQVTNTNERPRTRLAIPRQHPYSQQ